jgi:hypothetical protein
MTCNNVRVLQAYKTLDGARRGVIEAETKDIIAGSTDQLSGTRAWFWKTEAQEKEDERFCY